MDDFEKLREMNISVKGHIVIAKYGKLYRGDKVSTVHFRSQGSFYAIVDLFEARACSDYI